jgi:hypothetical protein
MKPPAAQNLMTTCDKDRAPVAQGRPKEKNRGEMDFKKKGPAWGKFPAPWRDCGKTALADFR